VVGLSLRGHVVLSKVVFLLLCLFICLL
jgi:hypothetical protein